MKRLPIGKSLFPLAVVFVVAMMVIPLPTAVLDLLLAMNLSARGAVPARLDERSQRRSTLSVVPVACCSSPRLFRLGAERHHGPTRALAGRRRQGRRGVRHLRHRRLAHRRPGDLPDPGRHPVRRDHQRREPRRRGRGALHPRRHARQADGDRRRPQRRRDRRRRGPAPPSRGRSARPTSTVRWTAPRSSSRATRSPRIVITAVNLIGGFAHRRAPARH